MTKVRVCLELDKDTYEAYKEEARRRRVKVETVIGKAVSDLIHDFEHDADEGPDFIIPS